jgi:hypothetical protein
MVRGDVRSQDDSDFLRGADETHSKTRKIRLSTRFVRNEAFRTF